jgi:hypothetical protein
MKGRYIMAKRTLEVVSLGTFQTEISDRQNAITRLETKLDRNLVENINFDSSDNDVTASVNVVDPSTNAKTIYSKSLPIASTTAAGMMPKESFAQIQKNSQDIQTLMNQTGGKYIGVPFATKAALDAYTIPTTVVGNDFTFVAADETHNNASTMYIYNATTKIFDFARVIEEIPVPTATEEALGLVKSSTENGKVLVENTGVMSLNGYSTLVSNDANLSSQLDAAGQEER